MKWGQGGWSGFRVDWEEKHDWRLNRVYQAIFSGEMWVLLECYILSSSNRSQLSSNHDCGDLRLLDKNLRKLASERAFQRASCALREHPFSADVQQV